MAYYDHFLTQKSASITPAGRRLVAYRNAFFADLIQNYHTSDKPRICEIGPGMGYFAEECFSRAWQYQAIEANSKLAQRLRETGVTVTESRVPPIQLKDRSVDVVYLNQVFEHMQDRSEACTVLEEIHRVLSNKGLAIIATPDIRFWKEDFFAADYTHSFPTSIQVLQQMAADYDFMVVQAGVYSYYFNATWLVSALSAAVRACFSCGLGKLVFAHKSYKIKCSLLPSCYVILQKA